MNTRPSLPDTSLPRYERRGGGSSDAQAELEAELAGTRLLHSLSVELVHEDDFQQVLEGITDAAVEILRSEFTSMQMFHSDESPGSESGGRLELLTLRGFDQRAARFWKWVDVESGSVCGEALRTGRRAVVRDVEACDFMAGTKDLEGYRRIGIRAAQSTPLRSREGTVLGMLSTHWSVPHEPTTWQLRLLDMLARQAADLIERKRAEQSLRKERRRAEEASRAKARILAVMSHELRAPLFGMIGYTRLLEDEVFGPLNPQQRNAVHRIKTNASHQAEMIEEVSTLSRIEAGTEEVREEEADLSKIAREVVGIYEPRCRESPLALRLEEAAEPVIVRTDPAKVRRILTNLVGNAVKYTERGEVAVLLNAPSSGPLDVHVHDTGPGIDPEHWDSVFEPFVRLADSPRRPEGMGLGLSICSNLARLIGAEVRLHSEPGKGTTFTLRLPPRGRGRGS